MKHLGQSMTWRHVQQRHQSGFYKTGNGGAEPGDQSQPYPSPTIAQVAGRRSLQCVANSFHPLQHLFCNRALQLCSRPNYSGTPPSQAHNSSFRIMLQANEAQLFEYTAPTGSRLERMWRAFSHTFDQRWCVHEQSRKQPDSWEVLLRPFCFFWI